MPNALQNSLMGDVVQLACDFIRYPSVTPEEAGCLTDLYGLLKDKASFASLVVWEDTTNLYVRFGQGEPHLCFAGHVDVVPPGPEDLWTFPPFQPTCHEGWLYGRGVADMKGAIACFLSAFFSMPYPTRGSVSLLLTSDEEGPGHNGIPRMIPWLQEKQEIPNVILIGEPTGEVGQVLQVGRRGSLTGQLLVTGKQGHIAYPHLAHNPIPPLVHCLQGLLSMPLDSGTPLFEPSRLAITAIETHNPAENVTPASVEARFGIRYNPLHTALSLSEKVEAICAAHAPSAHQLLLSPRGDPFLTPIGPWVHCVAKAMGESMGSEPRLITHGGTTDGRFLCQVAPVVEVGLPEDTIHQINERARVEDLHQLRKIYVSILQHFFAKAEATISP